ncbi:hypothetical protein CMUS01_08637 [Colletotrichum musicola]|uniref:Uncharacterized protein n=1 Tax=Colletotrichum musicola TaxID=2175873 RepID=A0A8H6KBE5_9PEZI|nr:hypothetical protein CMUS01_08637 [Colletotrichum musicola]
MLSLFDLAGRILRLSLCREIPSRPVVACHATAEIRSVGRPARWLFEGDVRPLTRREAILSLGSHRVSGGRGWNVVPQVDTLTRQSPQGAVPSPEVRRLATDYRRSVSTGS